MNSFIIPSNIKYSLAPGFIKIEGPKGFVIKKTGDYTIKIINTSQGERLFVQGNSTKEEGTALAHLAQLSQGLSCGFRRRLRLTGFGFRAVLRDFSLDTLKQKKTVFNLQSSTIATKNYRRKRRLLEKGNQIKALSLKIGFSHESRYPIDTAAKSTISVARLEGRSKGTLINVEGSDCSKVNQIASEIRKFRLPDAYKGKGIHFTDKMNNLRLKKGKRQG